MTCRPVWLLWLILLTAASPAAAHPGHGTSGSEASPTHYVTEPVHLLFLVAALALGLAAAAWMTRKSLSHRRA